LIGAPPRRTSHRVGFYFYQRELPIGKKSGPSSRTGRAGACYCTLKGMALSGGEISEILESITDAFLALDTDGRFTYVNRQAERMIGLKRQDLLGQNVWDVFPHLKDSRMYTEYERAVRTQQPVEFEEFYAERKAWLEVRAYPNPDGMTIYYRDVTKRKRADEAQRALVAMVSHDLRNPLFLSKGTTELLRDQLGKLPNASGAAAQLE